MKKSTINLSVQAATYRQRLQEEIIARRERGAVTTETVVITLGLFLLATVVIGMLTTWATGKLGGLN